MLSYDLVQVVIDVRRVNGAPLAVIVRILEYLLAR